MPTDYTFPVKKWATNDVISKEDLNRNLMPAVDRYNGGMGPHNIKSRAAAVAESKSIDDVAQYAFMRPHFVVKDVDPGVAQSTPPTTAGSGPDASSKIEDTYEWQLVDDMQLNITLAGRAFFKIYAWCQVFRDGWASGPYTLSSEYQLALRVDGRILEDQFTGFQEESENNFMPLRPHEPKSKSPPIPPKRIAVRKAHACAFGAKPTLLTYTLMLEPGSHTIELCARRVFLDPRRIRTATFTSGNIDVYVYSRKLIALEHSYEAAAGSGDANLTVSPFESEQPLSKADLGTAKLEAIAGKHNSASAGLEEGSIHRGGLNHNHLPSPLLDWGFASWNTAADETIRAEYQAYNSNTTTTNQTGGNGWFKLNDGTAGSGDFKVEPNGGGDFQTSAAATDLSFILVIGTVQVRNVRPHTALSVDPAYFGALGLGYKLSGGSDAIIDNSIGFVNYQNIHQTAGAARTEVNSEACVSLLSWVDLRTAPQMLANDIDYFQIYGAAIDARGTTANDTRLTHRRGSLLVLQFGYQS